MRRAAVVLGLLSLAAIAVAESSASADESNAAGRNWTIRAEGDEDVLFADDFDDGLSETWQMVGLEKSDFRLREGGLEMRVQPGEVAADTPMLRIFLPFTDAETVIASVRVTLLDEFTEEHEFVGLYLIDEDGAEFSAKKERLVGKLVFSPGVYEFVGPPGEEGDPNFYNKVYTMAPPEAGPLRIIVDRGHAYFQVGPSETGRFQNVFHSAIRKETTKWGFALIAAGGPKGAEHWVRFDDFRVFRR